MDGTEAGNALAIIRQATLGDVERLADLCGQLGYPLSPQEVKPRLVEIMQDEPNDVYVAVDGDGRVIGWVQVYVRQLLMVERHAEMGGLVVDKEYRDRGIGRMLVDWAEAWARDHGCSALYLRSNVHREAAHRFYERAGYQLVKTQRAYWKSVAGQDGAADRWLPGAQAGAKQSTVERF